MLNFLKCRFLWLIILLILFNLPAGCAITEPRPIDQKGIDKIDPKQVIQSEKPIKTPGPPPFSEKVSPVTKGLIKETKLYSMSFDNAPLGEVIAAITNGTDLNLSVVSGIDLARPVTVKLKNTTFSEALNMVVVKGSGYAWKIEEDCLYITRFEERIYHLDYLDMTGDTEIEVGGDMLASSVENSGVTGKYQIKAKRTAKNIDVWSGIQKSLEGLKSPAGILQINRTAGIIYLADTPRKIASMVKFLDSLTESLHRQVFIEAKILEVSLSDSYKYGIDWSKLEIGFKSSSSAMPDALDISFNQGGAILLSDASRFGAILDFLHTQGDVTVLSNPHLSVINGQSAIMTVGFQFPYGDISGVDRDTDTGVITFGTSIKRAILGLQLGLTPQISTDGVVTLHIVPTITRIQSEEKVEIPTTATSSQSISNPIIDLREMATTVRVREGRSVVLAGLISQIKRINHEGLPWLSNIPVLKYFFKHMEKVAENRELVIFITPYIKEVI
jgi:MSHA type pilus biogenesis protein MshL